MKFTIESKKHGNFEIQYSKDEYDFESKRFKDLIDRLDTLTDEIRAESIEIILISNREIMAQMLKNIETLK